MNVLAKLLAEAHSWRVPTRDIRVGYATIGDQTWPCARYVQTLETPSGSIAAGRGETTYTREQIYCVGGLPAGYEKSRYRLPGDPLAGHAIAFPYEGFDWYVAGYSPKVIEPKFAQFHKLGPNFVLMPWSVPSGEPIDHYYIAERGKPYKRVPLSVRYVDADEIRKGHRAPSDSPPRLPGRKGRHRV